MARICSGRMKHRLCMQHCTEKLIIDRMTVSFNLIATASEQVRNP
ncbi:hypothetical protein DFQ00_13636 [Paenibacillus barcinonensis]|uniref:Uncharacterized protein n=1 Tax=Paenibacillus barcinonensis TaxID=198119 RepID=A0A2V4V8Y7_PAEBA|nr:hypothetical protein DFQ00_13636 [Paenibacillus barcinonensis]